MISISKKYSILNISTKAYINAEVPTTAEKLVSPSIIDKIFFSFAILHIFSIGKIKPEELVICLKKIILVLLVIFFKKHSIKSFSDFSGNEIGT